MAWPQAPQPAPAATPASSLPIGALVTAGAAVLTFLFSFVRIAKTEAFGFDAGWSVWTVDDVPPGLFGVGTYIPLLALVAGGAALAGSVVAGLRGRTFGGFTVLQVQEIAAGGAALLWLGYLIGIVLGDAEMGLGLFLLFLGVVGVGAGTVLTAMEAGKASTPGAAPSAGGWAQPSSPVPPAADPGTWQQPVADPASGSWQQPAAPASGSWPAPPAPESGSWQQPAPPATWEQTVVHGQPAAPGGWQQPGPQPSDPYAPQPGSPGPVPEPGPLDPQPAPPVDPQPEPAPAPGILSDPGTQVIPGPPPVPPADGGTGYPPPPPAPPSNT